MNSNIVSGDATLSSTCHECCGTLPAPIATSRLDWVAVTPTMGGRRESDRHSSSQGNCPLERMDFLLD